MRITESFSKSSTKSFVSFQEPKIFRFKALFLMKLDYVGIVTRQLLEKIFLIQMTWRMFLIMHFDEHFLDE